MKDLRTRRGNNLFSLSAFLGPSHVMDWVACDPSLTTGWLKSLAGVPWALERLRPREPIGSCRRRKELVGLNPNLLQELLTRPRF